ncbi:MAG: amidohydrolase family protein [Deltaproteobacteria bacterium]|nr:amidohydrolase family protein [Deltaproteobacteria bacterium]MBW2725500.1 amidohydrolase family protein [Deltaproteobacteria bacterium]
MTPTSRWSHCWIACLAICGLLAGCGAPPPSVEVSRPDPAPPSIVIQNVSVFDSMSLEIKPAMDVMLKDGVIAAVEPSGQLQSTAGARIISGAGATLVPGLIDMHGHIYAATGPTWLRSAPDPEANLRAYVYSGVTTVFDPSDPSGDAFARRDRVRSGDLIGPRIFTTGKLITCSEGHPRSIIQELAPGWIAWYFVSQVATAVDQIPEANREVDRLAQSGADAVKIVVDRIPLEAPRMSREIAAAIAARAKSHGLRTVAHIGTTEDAIDAAEAGIALWVHGVYKERIPDDEIATLAGYGIPMVTTSEVFDRWGRGRSGPVIATKLERETVPESVLEAFYPIPEDFDLGSFVGWLDLMRDTRQTRIDNVRRLHEAGVTILAGSDVQSGVFPGAALHRELANLVAAGFSPAEAIRAATLDPARFLANGGEPDSGVIEAGKRADLLLVNGDPSTDIHALAEIREVFLQGVPVERTAVAAVRLQ